jgi:hypothetical protein
VLKQIAKGLPEKFGDADNQYELRPPALKDLESIKWYLWHGNVFKALDELQGLGMDLDAASFETKNEAAKKLLKGWRSCVPVWSETANSFPTRGSAIETGKG